MEKANLLVGQSGGPTCVINSSLLGVIKEAKKHSEINMVLGSLNGIDGIINENLVNLYELDDENLNLLKQTPSAILGSVRHCLPDDFNDEIYNTILNNFKKYNIHYFLYIGGNDSMDTVLKLSNYFKKVNYQCNVLGIPKTIDNDLDITDHTPGYGSAIKFIANSVTELIEDTKCYESGRVTIVEIMGRDAGWLTAGSKLASLNNANPDLIYLPEYPFDVEEFLVKVKEIYDKKKKVFVCISEGIKGSNGHYVVTHFAYNQDNDVFGHMQLGGAAEALTHYIKEKLNLPVRAIELNLLQRCSASISSLKDINEAIRCGMFGVKKVLANQTGKMVIMKRVKSDKYQIKYDLTDIQNIANVTKYFPSEWIVNGCDISNEFINYALPLIKGQKHIKTENSLIKFASISSLKKI